MEIPDNYFYYNLDDSVGIVTMSPVSWDHDIVLDLPSDKGDGVRTGDRVWAAWDSWTGVRMRAEGDVIYRRRLKSGRVRVRLRGIVTKPAP